ncbi:hypothetical protein V2A84_13290 [Yersinia sp. 2553 StPb PI]|uniref:hypothetical protein n=1 Tax=unclassified Yersinia (in: enterobacteria) TaxID=2653513 RepID=UPI003B27DADB
MTNNKIGINSSRASSSILEGARKANSAVQKQKFDELFKNAARRTHKGDSTVSHLNPHTLKNMISFFVKLDVPDNTADKPAVPSASPLTDEGKAILADSQSQLSIRTVFSKVTHKLINPSWDFKTAHFLKL